jgi:hypothetical protein
VAKSGTNEIHGNLFEFVRKRRLERVKLLRADAGYAQAQSVWRIRGRADHQEQTVLLRHLSGNSDPERGARQRCIRSHAAERTGNFAGSGIAVTDPTTGQPFPNDQIPANRLSAPAQFFLNDMPLPNGPNGQLTFAGANIVPNDDQYVIKINWLQSKNQVSGSWFWTRFSEPPDVAIGKQNILSADGSGNRVTIKNLALNDIYSLSPTVLFNTWFGWSAQTGRSLSGAPFGFPDAGIQIAAPTPQRLACR